MCGIFGFTGHSSWKTSVLLQALCIADEVRGQHSTGLVVQTSTSDFFMSKKALRGKSFVARGIAPSSSTGSTATPSGTTASRQPGP